MTGCHDCGNGEIDPDEVIAGLYGGKVNSGAAEERQLEAVRESCVSQGLFS